MDETYKYDVALSFAGEDRTYYYYNPAQKWIKVKQIESVKLIRDDAFSGRERIQNNTIPLLKNHVFIGSDANTFALGKPRYFFSAAYVYDRCTSQ